MAKKVLGLFLMLLVGCGGSEQQEPMKPVLLASSVVSTVNDSPYIAPGERRSYEIQFNNGTGTAKSKVSSLADFRTQLQSIRLEDISLSFDADGVDGQLYRLYQASFGRTPDVLGYGYWRDAVHQRGLRLADVADNFLNSAEFKNVYGSAPDDQAIVGKLYQNILGRSADSAGAAYWTSALKNGMARRDMLLAFADSAENRSATATATKGGMPFAEPGISYIPVSNATGPYDVPVGVPFQVDGSPSTDANGDKLTYSWSVTARPALSLATFANPNIAKTNFVPDSPGVYQLTLWASDAKSRSFSPAQLTVTAHALFADAGIYTCLSIDTKTASYLYSTGHSYLDRDKDGVPCTTADMAYEKSPPVPTVVDTGRYKCSEISHSQAVLLYLQGHTYLDRDHDGMPCEATDITVEHIIYPPVTTPVTPSNGMCWVNGYTRKDGTHVSGYWRRC